MKTLKIMLGFALFFIASMAFASDEHHNYHPTEENINNAYSSARSEVRAAAAGQTNYKSTPNLQWNLGAAFSGGESALNIGFGYQAGDVFIAGGLTDNTDTMFTSESDPLVTISVGGEF